jgi:hypothetical protein
MSYRQEKLDHIQAQILAIQDMKERMFIGLDFAKTRSFAIGDGENYVSIQVPKEHHENDQFLGELTAVIDSQIQLHLYRLTDKRSRLSL